MKILYYDCFSGISGDMNLAAMIDLGVEPEVLIQKLSGLGLDDRFSLQVSRQACSGIWGTQVHVVLEEQDHSHYRTLQDIEALIQESRLSETVKTLSLKMFTLLAEAEARVHGKGVYEIHFHEVGAVDAIVDIVGAAICYEQLGIDAVWCSAVELGSGFVHCAHGIMPVPVPAVVEILKGCPVSFGEVKEETTTPTGAAVLLALTDRFTDTARMQVEKAGYGIGHRKSKVPNMLRAYLARVFEHPGGPQKTAARLLECNIDDMTAEALGTVMDTLMENGAMDVSFTPVIMKKNRPATTISLLCADEDEDRFKDLLLQHTTTLGVKSIAVEKTKLERTFETLKTPLGPVTMKKALFHGKVIRSKPELEDCLRLARTHGIPLHEVYLHIGRHQKTGNGK